MATLKCLACGHDNNVGDESCSSCSSSLNLKLCRVCDAINANSAERCHSCKAEFRAEPETATLLEAGVPPGGGVAPEAPPVARYLPVAWRMAAERARKRSTKIAAALWLASVVATGLASYFYAVSRAGPSAAPAQKVEAAQKSEPAALPEAPKEPAKPQTAEVKQPQAPAVSGRITPPKTAPAPVAKSTPPSEPKRTTAVVTHTRAAGTDTPAKTTGVTLPVAARPVPAAPASAGAATPPVSEPPAANPPRGQASVTHTKADAAAATTAPVAATTAAAASEGRSAVAEPKNDQPAGCAASVAALGLCKSK